MGQGNEVRFEGGRAVKQHAGPDGARRAASAVVALREANAHGLPVPDVLELRGATLVTAHVTDVVDGAGLLATDARTVLRAVGAVARRLHALPPPPELAGVPTAAAGDVAAWVHGDLCPVNLLFAGEVGPAGGRDLRAVVDWEDTRVDDPVVDLAWTEWLVRTWHAPVVPLLPQLYDAYGSLPDDAARRRAMRTCLERQRGRGRPGDPDWAAHLAALDDLPLDW